MEPLHAGAGEELVNVHSRGRIIGNARDDLGRKAIREIPGRGK